MRYLELVFYNLVIGIIFSLLSLSLKAAEIQTLWGPPENYQKLFSSFKIDGEQNHPFSSLLPKELKTNNKASQTLQILNASKDSKNTTHIRLQQKFHERPVFGYELIYHKKSTGKSFYTGQLVTGIKKDILNQKIQITSGKAKQIAFDQSPGKDILSLKQIIYIDNKNKNKAVLAYYLIYKAKINKEPALLHFIINANNGKILKHWNGMQNFQLGLGLGGYTFSNLTYRPGHYQFGPINSQDNTFDKLFIQLAPYSCNVSNEKFVIFNLYNQEYQVLPFTFPLSHEQIDVIGLKPFSYFCTLLSYLNENDEGFAPINDGNSPINDVNFFLNKTYQMFQEEYGLENLMSDKLPIYVFTHIGNYDNALAISHAADNTYYPNQLIFGNGSMLNAPHTSPGTCAHEFGHILTNYFSNLIYSGQSGAINEAFSDMTSIAFKSYLRKQYEWVWDGLDWAIGRDVNKLGVPIRYMDLPSLNGHSIEHISSYVEDMDVHEASGIFSHAFYLLSTHVGWTVEDAYKLMLQANQHYWHPNSKFESAACDVIFAAKDLEYEEEVVRQAFLKVGISCSFED